MGYFINSKDRNIVEPRNGNYVIDKKDRRLIERYVKKIGINDLNIFELLDMLGFNKYNNLYLNIEKDKNRIKINYSDNEEEFDLNNFICFDYVMDRHISVYNRDSFNEYYIKREYPSKRISLENSSCVIRKNINGIEYCVSLYNNCFKLFVKDNVGMEIKLDCSEVREKDKLFLFLNDLKMMDEYLFSIKIDDKLDKVYNKWISKLMDIGFMKFNLSCISEGRIVSNYIVNNYNNRLEVISEDYLKKISYERNISRRDDDCNNIVISFKNGDYKFVIDYIDNKDNKVLNEMELINSFRNIKFPIKIDELCKLICNVSFGYMKKYLDISLKMYHNNLRKDVFSLKNGKLDYFQNIDCGKKITIGHDGVFSYVNEDDISKYRVEINGDIVTRFEQFNEYGINNDNNKGLYLAIKEAAEEKIRVKKLVYDLVK